MSTTPPEAPAATPAAAAYTMPSALGALNAKTRARQRMLLLGGGGTAAVLALWAVFGTGTSTAPKLAAWTAQITAARNGLADRQQTTQARVTAIMAIIEKTQFLENVLASSMSPGMAASLDWSRGVATRGLN